MAESESNIFDLNIMRNIFPYFMYPSAEKPFSLIKIGHLKVMLINESEYSTKYISLLSAVLESLGALCKTINNGMF